MKNPHQSTTCIFRAGVSSRWLRWLSSGLIWLLLASTQAGAYTANKVWFEFHPGGIFRVVVNYTVPELKEFREAWVEFRSKREAERFYFDLLRGADFYPEDPRSRRFSTQPRQPDPW